MKILGLDIGGGEATAFLLCPEDLAGSIDSFTKSANFKPFKVELTHQSLTSLVELKPDLVVFEPTGEHYERAFVHWFEKFEIPYKRAVGTRIGNFRKDKGLPKTDDLDSFSLALYGLYKLDPNSRDYDPKAFLPAPSLPELRQWLLLRRSLSRRRAGLINRFRQELTACFPEARNVVLEREWGDVPVGILLWLAEEPNLGKVKAYWDNKAYPCRIRRAGKWLELPGTCGEGISENLKILGREILGIDRELGSLEERIDTLLSEGRFQPYLEAFNKVGGSRQMIAVYLSRIYPFSRFLDDNNEPIVIRRMTKLGRWATYDRSLAQFKAALGAGTIENTSGLRQKKENRKSKRKNKGNQSPEAPIGDKLSRTAFYTWANAQVEGLAGKKRKGMAVDIPCSEELLKQQEKLAEKGKNLYQRIGSLQGYHAKLLYRELKKSLSKVPCE
jgi:hypothetical protein